MSRRSFLAGGGAPASFQHGQGGRYAAFSCQGLIHRFRRYLNEVVYQRQSLRRTNGVWKVVEVIEERRP